MERFYYGSTIAGFLKESESSILGKLGTADGFDTTRDQTNAWVEEVRLLQSILAGIEGWIFFEYSIPRLGKRVDVVLLVKGTVFNEYPRRNTAYIIKFFRYKRNTVF